VKYITVSIGNTDNRLTQQEWSDFVIEMYAISQKFGKVHFFGGSPNWERWQNAAWIVEPETKTINVFLSAISELRMKWKQESAFVMIADGMFI